MDMAANMQVNGQDTKQWWKYGYVWLILSGPIAVIIASFITLSLALKTPDPVVDDYYRKGIEINKRLETKELLPAVEGRNHAVTPAEDTQP
jgi:hypothetical protein